MIKFFASIASRFGMNPKEAERFIKFAIVGTIGFVIDFGTLAFLKEILGFHTLVANTISFSAAVTSNFLFNRFWTYPDSRSKSLWMQMGQFFVVNIIGLLINNTILHFLEAVFNDWLSHIPMLVDRGYIFAKMVATIVVLFWNFFINRYWTYGDVE